MLDGDEKNRIRRQVVRNAFREAIAVAIILGAVSLWVLTVVRPEQVALSQIQQAFLDLVALAAMIASGYLVFGHRVFEQALEFVEKFRGD